MCHVLLACHNSSAFDRASLMVCQIIERTPAYQDGARPSLKTLTQDCKDLLEARRWKMVRRDYTPPVCGDELLRDEVRLSWAEKQYFFRTWLDAEKGERQMIHLFCRLLGRTKTNRLTTYLEKLVHNPLLKDIELFNPALDPVRHQEALASWFSEVKGMPVGRTVLFHKLLQLLGVR